jgi:flagellar biosynthetic protein FliQ
METDFFIGLLGSMFQMALKVAMPLLVVTLVVGVLISVLQVVTQIQEMTLTFVPKLVLMVITLAFAGPWMLQQVVDFSIATISQIKDF